VASLYSPKFLTADVVIAFMEKGHANNPADPGGDTWYGISRRWHPHEDPWPPTPQRAQQIRHDDYWVACCCDALPTSVGLLVYDTAVTSAPLDAKQTLQRAINATHYAPALDVDGVIGDKTLAAAAMIEPRRLAAEFLARRALDMQNASAFKTFAHGWYVRLFLLATANVDGQVPTS
jgi:lysozyme family protein